MNETRVLMSHESSYDDKYSCAATLIKNYDLPLDEQQILAAFERMSRCYAVHDGCIYQNRLFIMTKLLEINIKLYISVILALNNDSSMANNMYHIIKPDRLHKPLSIGGTSSNHTYVIYCLLLKYYDFDVSNLDLTQEQKDQIMAYRNKLYSGKLVKSAVVSDK